MSAGAGPGRACPFVDRWLLLTGPPERIEVVYASFEEGAGGRAHAAETSVWPTTSQRLARHSARLDTMRATDLISLGEALSWIALPRGIREPFVADVEKAQTQGRRLRMRVRSEAESLAGWPWEYIWLSELGFVSLHPHCSIVRTPASGSTLGPDRSSADRPVVFLVLYADPLSSQLGPLGANTQVGMIREILKRLPKKPEVKQLLPAYQASNLEHRATRNNLARVLHDDSIDVLHILAHGVYDEELGEGVVFLEAEDGDAVDAVPAGELASLFPPGNGPALVLLDACESGSAGRGAHGRSVAVALAERVGAVVGMQFPWPAGSSGPFWTAFYSSLVVPQPLEECLFAGRQIVHRIAQFMGDWGCPTLFRTVQSSPPCRSVRSPVSLGIREFDLALAHLEQEWSPRIDDLLRPVRALRDRIHARIEADPAGLSGSVRPLIEEVDPLMIWLAGEDDVEMSEPSPAWFTYLAERPGRISWPETLGSPPWSVSCLRPDRTPLVSQKVWRPDIALPGQADWSEGWFRWEVRSNPTDDGGSKRMRGMFRVLSPDRLQRFRAEMAAVRDAPAEALAAVEIGWGLYEAALARLRRVDHPSDRQRMFVVRRLFAKIYSDIQRELTGARRLGDPEGLWAAALAQYHIEASYRMLGLH